MIRGDKGFTVLELLIGMLLSGIVVSAALSLYVTGHEHLIVQDEIADLQSAVRSSAEMIAKHIRMAGYNVPVTQYPIETFDTDPDTIIVTYDSEKLRDVNIEQDMPDRSSPIRCDGHDISGLSPGGWIYVFDPITLTGEFCAVSDVDQGNAVIIHDTMPLSRSYPAGSKVLELNHIKFYVDRADSSQSNLMIQQIGSAPELYAENISDLNFRYILLGGAVVDQTNVPSRIRMVEIDIAARASKPDSEFGNVFRIRRTTFRVKVRNL